MKKGSKLWIVTALLVAMIGIMVTGCGQEKETTVEQKDSKVDVVKVADATYVKYSENATAVTMSFVKEGENWLYEADKEAKIIQAMFAENVLAFSNIKGKVVTDLSKEDCYLTEPMYTLEVKNADTTVVIHISENEDGVCYAMLDGKDNIYKIDDDAVNAMTFHISGLQEPVPGEEMYGYILNEDEIVEEDTFIPDDEVYEEPSEPEIGEEDMTDIPVDDTGASDDIETDDTVEDDVVE